LGTPYGQLQKWIPDQETIFYFIYTLLRIFGLISIKVTVKYYFYTYF
jgi:hypothetical protein